MSIEFLIKNIFQSYSARTGFIPIHHTFVALRVVNNLFDQVFVMSSPSPLHRLATQAFDDRYKSKYSESFLRQQEHIIWVSRNITLRTQYLHLGVFLSKQYIILPNYKDLQVAKFSFMYSFTHTNIVFLFRHLPTEIVNFINVVTR